MKRLLGLWCAVGLAACNGGGNGDNGSLAAGPYFALTPGVCFDFKSDAGESASVDVTNAVSPSGLAIEFAQSGLLAEKDFVSLDGGNVFLAERIYSMPNGNLSDIFSEPLLFLSSPVGNMLAPSTSNYVEGNALGMQTMGAETLTVDENVATAAWSGFGAMSDAVETKINFTFSIGDGGGGTVVSRWLTPGVGFTDLYMANTSGVYVDFLLTGAHPDDAGCP